MSELVVITDDRHAHYEREKEILEDHDIELKLCHFESEEEAVETLHTATGVLNNLFPMTEQVISRLEKCRIISRYGVGYDNVNINAATNKNIWVSNVPDYATEDTSDHAVAMLLASIRKLAYKDRMIRHGKWNIVTPEPIPRIRGKVLGIAGLGKVGTAIIRKLSGFSPGTVVVYDPHKTPEYVASFGAQQVDLETFCKSCDFIMLSPRLTGETFHLLDHEQFALMKKSVIIINTSRGPVVREEALYKALDEGQIAYAGLDVFETEPLPKESVLRNLDNIILTDHAAYYSEESIVELKETAAMNIVNTFRQGRPLHPVNKLPENQL